MPESKSRLLLEHPEVRETLSEVFHLILAESDRGAVLFGAEVINTYLERTFRRIAPKGMSSRRLKDLLDYTGPLGSFSARISLAYACRLITSDLFKALHILRSLRNEAAHPEGSFSLADYKGS